jgi:hypothetical protein
MTKKLLLLLFIISFNFNYSQNNYLDFDGIDDYVNVTNSDNILANATNITMSCKVFPRRVSSGFPDFNGFLGYRNETNFDFYLIQLSSTDLEARFRNSSGVAYSITYTGLVLNQWTQFFLVYNGTSGTLKLYSGTTEVSSVPASGAAPSSSTGNFKIGLVTYQAFNWYHNGKIDETSLWNKALSPAEIGAIVTNSGEIQNPLSETNLKLYYKFNQGIPYSNNTSVTSVTDELGLHNGNALNFNLTGNSSNWGSDTLGLNQLNTTHQQVYPNPANDFISIYGIAEPTTVKIVDISGRIVATETLLNEDSKLNISYLNSGIYFLSTAETTIKFIKN